MKVIVNGREIQAGASSVSEYIENAGWKPSQVVVEYNGEVLPRRKLADVRLKDGDRLEIVLPVAGG